VHFYSFVQWFKSSFFVLGNLGNLGNLYCLKHGTIYRGRLQKNNFLAEQGEHVGSPLQGVGADLRVCPCEIIFYFDFIINNKVELILLRTINTIHIVFQKNNFTPRAGRKGEHARAAPTKQRFVGAYLRVCPCEII
ncbi:MAG: hypothetical protein DRR00_26350, partial [Candidatus Parabeggiatoa sp. nov. 3]